MRFFDKNKSTPTISQWNLNIDDVKQSSLTKINFVIRIIKRYNNLIFFQKNSQKAPDHFFLGKKK